MTPTQDDRYPVRPASDYMARLRYVFPGIRDDDTLRILGDMRIHSLGHIRHLGIDKLDTSQMSTEQIAEIQSALDNPLPRGRR